MDLPNTILVPTDFTKCGQDAVRYGLKLAKQLDARLYITHAWLTPISKWEGGWALPQDVMAPLEGAARDRLTAIVDQARSERASTQALFYVGDPRDSIIKAIGDCHAQLVVMGTHGRRGLSHMLMGSVAEFVVRHATCPVLTVRHPEED